MAAGIMSVAAFQHRAACSFELGKADQTPQVLSEYRLGSVDCVISGKVRKFLGGLCGIAPILPDDRGGMELGELILNVNN